MENNVWISKSRNIYKIFININNNIIYISILYSSNNTELNALLYWIKFSK